MVGRASNVGAKLSINPTPCAEVLCPAGSVFSWCCAPSPSPSRAPPVPTLPVRARRNKARCATSITRTPAPTDHRASVALDAGPRQLLQGLAHRAQRLARDGLGGFGAGVLQLLAAVAEPVADPLDPEFELVQAVGG